MSEKILAIIPTRGGSEGIKSKNIYPFEGKPLVAHTILEALACATLSDVFVTTDNNEIEAVARDYGAQVFRHPPELSVQGKPTAPVIQHVAREITGASSDYSHVAVLRATSPLRTADDIEQAYKLMSEREAHSVVSLARDDTMHPIRLKYLDEQGYVRDMQPAESGAPIRRQELPPTYRRTGAIYIAYLNTVLDGKLWSEDCVGYVLTQERAININTSWDLVMAAAYYRAIHSGEFAEYLAGNGK